MRKEDKATIIEEIAGILSSYNTVYVADISGLTVERSNTLRRMCFKKGVKIKMVKNTFLKRAMEQLDTDYSEMYPVLHGTSAIMVSETGNMPARIIKEFRGKNEIPAVKARILANSLQIRLTRAGAQVYAAKEHGVMTLVSDGQTMQILP